MRSDQLVLGAIGLGRGFMLTLPALRANRDLRLGGAFDVRSEARAAFSAEFGAPSFDSLDELLSSPEIQAVYIASPHELHAAQTIAALQAGKHVLVEKPMAISTADGEAMVSAARRTERVLLVGPSHGFDAPVLRAAQLVGSGRYGQVRHVTALNYTDFMYRPRRAKELNEAHGGGVIFSQAAHQIDTVRRLIGARVRSVRAVTGDWDMTRSSIGAYSALLTFEGGATASLTYSGYAHYDSDEQMGWISELGQIKDPAAYGEARRQLAGLDANDEALAKLSRTYGSRSQVATAAAPHHEHFGFVLISCDHADLKLMPNGIAIYADDSRSFEPLDPPVAPRCGVLEAFLSAITREGAAATDGSWGLDTIACCSALLASSRSRADVAPDDLLHCIRPRPHT